MNRRNFITASTVGLSALPLLSEVRATANATSLAPFPRYQFPMNTNWLYGGKAAAGAALPNFNDAQFQWVTLPHTNQLLPWHSFDEKEFQFVSIYRRHFRLPPVLRGCRVFVDFAGVMTAATVTINGEKLGEYKGGYTPFSFELTNHLKWEGDNLLAVEVDSTERAAIPPFGKNIDYLTFGGIYREVSLRAVPDLRLDGYIGGKQVISKTLPGNDTDHELRIEPDDLELVGDGIDATRVVLKVVNSQGGWRPFSTGSVSLQIEGPGEIIGENPFALVGGAGAVWIKTKQGSGLVRLKAQHQYLGNKTVEIHVKAAILERV
jgi:beta-galactosidase